MGRIALILGGARSGKSALAERLCAQTAERTGARKTYVATARREWEGVADPEFAARIAEHERRRGPEWETVESPTDLQGALTAADAADRVFLVDCLSLWLTNRLLATPAPDEAALEREDQALVAALRAMRATVVLVSNEVGLGLTPETPLGRRFRDAQGRLNQTAAASADLVVFVAAGLPLTLKGVLSEWD